MSIRYRAIWEDNRPDLIESGKLAFQEWMNDKKTNLLLPSEGEEKSERNQRSNSVNIVHESEDKISVLRIRLDEESPIKRASQRWSTTAIWMVDETSGWVWIDVEWVCDDISIRQPHTAAPNLVSKLLELRKADNLQDHIGPHPLRVSKAQTNHLIEWIYDDNRTIPVVVFSVDTKIDPPAYSDRVKETARRLAGCVSVHMLTADSEQPFNNIMDPQSMSVFRGAVRTYMPGIDKQDPQPWRHRFILSQHLTADPKRSASLIAEYILPRMAAQRSPSLYRTHVKALLAQRGQRDWASYAVELDDRNTYLENEISRLQSDLEVANIDRNIAWEEADESERNLLKLGRKLKEFENHLRAQGAPPEHIEQQMDQAIEPENCQHAILLAQHLDNISIHQDAPREIERMDQQPHSRLWALRILRHLQALDAYAESKGSGFNGGFKEWCENSGDTRAISPKFVAISESEYVRNNRQLLDRRTLAVDVTVEPTGKISMLAHLKPIEGGGGQIPRIYFHDDTKGATGKVHIGFIGPHDLMPNQTTSSM